MKSSTIRARALVTIAFLVAHCNAFDAATALADETLHLECPDFLGKARQIKPWLIEVRKDLHRHPELGFEEARTSGKVKECLRAEGIEFKEMAKTGVCAIIRGKRPGATIAIRADMDALPIADTKKVDHASQTPGKCHACGHDAHMTILMGTARVLQSVREDLPGNVKLLFEPAEECGGGAAEMVERGVLKDPDVDAVSGLHMCHSAAETIFVKRNGPMHVASSPICVRVKGKAGHSAFINPDTNCVLVAGNVLAELHDLAKRLASTTHTRLGVGRIEAGIRQNTVNDEAVILGTIRSVTEEGVLRTRTDIEEILTSTAGRTQCQCVLEQQERSTKPVYNAPELVDLLVEVAERVLGPGRCNVSASESPACFGGESFGDFAVEKPSLFYWLGGAKGRPHAGDYDIDHEVLPLGVALHCGLAWEFLQRRAGEMLD
jgi:amidohydrolase